VRHAYRAVHKAGRYKGEIDGRLSTIDNICDGRRRAGVWDKVNK